MPTNKSRLYLLLSRRNFKALHNTFSYCSLALSVCYQLFFSVFTMGIAADTFVIASCISCGHSHHHCGLSFTQCVILLVIRAIGVGILDIIMFFISVVYHYLPVIVYIYCFMIVIQFCNQQLKIILGWESWVHIFYCVDSVPSY